MKLLRYDKITLDRPRAVMLDNGMMRVPARLSRVGVQDYRRADGSIERAYRPPDEVAKSAPGFDGVTLVDDHPYADGCVVTADNFKKLSVGIVQNPVFKDGFIDCMLTIQDAAAVATVKAGKLELSAGYYVDRDETPGVTPDGQPYDFVQRNIRGNHVAIVNEGRAGPDVRIQLDAAISTDFPFAIPAKETTPKGSITMQKITVDGVEVEVSTTAAALFQKERAMASGLLDASKAEVAKLTTALTAKTAVCDAATEKVTALTAELKAAPEKLKAAMVERSGIEAKAKLIAPELKCDGLDNAALKRAACAAAKITVDGKSDAYVDVRFDIAAEAADKTNPAAEAVAAALKTAEKPTTDGDETPKQKMEREFFNPPAAK